MIGVDLRNNVQQLCREIHHRNVVKLHQVIVDPLDRAISMVFDYAEHDLLVFNILICVQ